LQALDGTRLGSYLVSANTTRATPRRQPREARPPTTAQAHRPGTPPRITVPDTVPVTATGTDTYTVTDTVNRSAGPQARRGAQSARQPSPILRGFPGPAVLEAGPPFDRGRSRSLTRSPTRSLTRSLTRSPATSPGLD